ncbi:MAG: anthranilate phosphoribosyltransferase [Cytophagales bacterium]|nr:anthranilate phosphoribosyltransferase [Cytophagales bacterium]
MKELLTEMTEHRSLDQKKAMEVLLDLASGKYNPSQVSAFMTVYLMRAITLSELKGFRDAMLELCVPVAFDRPVIDLCGTGGDGKNTFNISTAASFVVAGAGESVAKHGNYGVSSLSGSSNLLEYFGYRFTNDCDSLKKSLDVAGICFMHAPLFHPAMKNVAPIRKELGVKTFFNMLGPMVNPARPVHQLVGVFNLELARQYGYLYQQTDKNYVIIHDLNGYDEVSLTARFKMFSNTGETIVDPDDIGLARISESALRGGSGAGESSKVFLHVLEGTATPAQAAVVIANAGAALYCMDQKSGWGVALARADESLRSGRALMAFRKLLAVK